MYKIFIFFLVFSLLTGFVFTGCGGDSTSSVLQVATATPVSISADPLPDPEVDLLGSPVGGEKSIFSPVIDLITDGLKEGITVWIGDNTTGRVLDVISNKIGIPGTGDETSAVLKEMDAKLDLIISQLADINKQLDNLTGLISLSTVTMETYVGDSKLQTSIDNITVSFDSPSPSGLIYFADKGSALDPNSPDPVILNQLKSDIAVYYTNNTTAMQQEIQHIAGFICPATGEKGGLMLWAQKLVLSAQKGNLSDADFAMSSYLTLETYFSRILNYQTKALVIVVETLNYHDPNGTTGAKYLDYYNTNILKPEIIAFQDAVNVLMLNLIDYRTLDKYNNDAAFMNTEGIVHDDIYIMVLARSRFFCAQVMNAFEEDFGLYGAILTPYDYSPGTNSPATSLTLQFSGPTSFTTTVKPQNMISQFPYTRWYKDPNSVTHACADQNWSFFDFSTFNNGRSGSYIDPNIPAGTYTITLVDNGNKNSPWFHTDTALGQVTIKYYDPNNPAIDTATASPTDTNTVKFGCFSGRWNWGYNRLCSAPGTDWYKPGKNSVPYVEGTTHKYYDKDNPTIQNVSSGSTYWPNLSSVTFVNDFGIKLPSFKCTHVGECALAYSIQCYFIADPPPSTQSTHPPVLYCDMNNKVYYYNNDNLSNDCVNFHCKLDDDNLSSMGYYAYKEGLKESSEELTASGTVNINKSYPVLNTFSLKTSHKYTLQLDTAESFSAGTYEPTITSNIDLKWNMQVIYPYTDTTVFVN
ncbi:MAG: hypothetical protein ABRQ37_12445 [Candidatus Eremiobacterota bacterium]